MFSPLKFLLNKILDTLFPQFCLNCKKEGSLICFNCLQSIEPAEYLYCPFCSKPFRVMKTKRQRKGVCYRHRHSYLSGLFSAGSYQDPLIQRMIHCLKYPPFLKDLARPLAYLIIAHILLTEKQNFIKKAKNPLFVPLPLHKKRERERGFNQAELIARHLSDFFEIPLESTNLIKIKKTKPQTGLNKIQRQENVKGAFYLKNPLAITNKTIFLVDDVFTTGSTLSEAARILKKAGAHQVWGIVVARSNIFS